MAATTDSRWLRIAAWALGIGAVMVFLGYATFEQWAALVGGLL